MRRFSATIFITCLALVACKKEETATPTAAVKSATALDTAAADIIDARELERGVAADVTRLESFPVGSSTSGDQYYAAIAKSDKLGFPNDLPPAALADVITYAGYQGLKIEDIETLESSVLHDPAVLRTRVGNQVEFDQAFGTSPIAAGDLLSVRFFSPKITDVSGRQFPSGQVVTPKLGWRKAVRLRPRSGSDAQRHAVTAIYLLFNFFADPTAGDPFASHSVNNQVIFVQSAGSSYMVFGPLDGTSTSGQRITFLTASFDARDPTINNGLAKYHVPVACNQCHGNNGRLNFLDSDHWYDRVQAGDDFAALRSTNVGVLTDGGKILADGGATASTPQYEAAFDSLLTFNREVLAQNQLVAAASRQTRAAKQWVDLHAADRSYVPPLRRGIGATKWNAARELDAQLLPLLNRYCYRCHGSIGYNVFDRGEVGGNGHAGTMADRIEAPSPVFAMPIDRDLPAADARRLPCLLRLLDNEIATGIVTPPNCP